MKIIFTLAIGGIIFLFLLSFNQVKFKKNYKGLRGNYTFIPSGNLEVNDSSVSVNSFVMSQGEVTNFHWQEFLSYLKRNGEEKKLEICKVDSTLWNSKLNFNNSTLKDYYHIHPAYRDYPIVNVSKEAATLYCEWLTEAFIPNMDGASKLIFRLPTHEEWIYAAKGGLKGGEYSWGGPYLRNSEGQTLANYTRFGAEHITRDSLGDLAVVKLVKNMGVAAGAQSGEDITAPSHSYWPNGFGLYNMNGNVAEMVSDKDIVAGGSWKDPGFDVRNESFNPYNGAASNVGFRVVATTSAEGVSWLKIKKK